MTDVSICNQALSSLGANTISTFADGSVESDLCRDNYAGIRDAVLEAVDWSFAIKRVALAALAATPAFGYDAAFRLPGDCLRVLSVSDESTDKGRRQDWRKEGQDILCDASTLYVRYIARIENTNLYSSMFTQALVERLKSDFAMPITEDKNKQKLFWATYSAKMDDAATMDGLQGKADTIRSDKLARARTSGVSAVGPYV